MITIGLIINEVLASVSQWPAVAKSLRWMRVWKHSLNKWCGTEVNCT